jgi:chromosome segregation ATPase
MEQKIKFIIIGLAGLCIICLFLFIQAFSQQQRLTRESNDLRAENTSLINKAGKLENDLKELQNKIGSLQAERDKGVEDLNELQRKLDTVTKARDELIEQLKQKSQAQAAAVAQPAAPVEPLVPPNSDAYWGGVLKDKTDLEMQLTSIRTELKSLQISNEALQREKSVLEIDINSLRNDKKDLLRQLDYNKKLLDSMSQDVVREKNDKTAIQESLKAVQVQNSMLSKQLKGLVSRKEALDKKVQDLQEGKSTAEKRLNEMESMLTDKVSKVEALKQELDDIKSGKPKEINREPKESVELPAIVVRSAPGAEKGNASIQEFPGKVLAVNLDSNFVVIDLGSSSGVKAGDIFNVYRNARSIGVISVIQTRAGISACDIKRMNTPLKIGDSVK